MKKRAMKKKEREKNSPLGRFIDERVLSKDPLHADAISAVIAAMETIHALGAGRRAALPGARRKAKNERRQASDARANKIKIMCTDLERQRVPKHKWAGIVTKRLGISRATFSRRAPSWAKTKKES